MTARSLPCALCSKCQGYSYDPALIGNECGTTSSDGLPCAGLWQNRLQLSDWLSCSGCNGSGYIDKKRCLPCKSSGWLPAH